VCVCVSAKRAAPCRAANRACSRSATGRHENGIGTGNGSAQVGKRVSGVAKRYRLVLIDARVREQMRESPVQPPRFSPVSHFFSPPPSTPSPPTLVPCGGAGERASVGGAPQARPPRWCNAAGAAACCEAGIAELASNERRTQYTHGTHRDRIRPEGSTMGNRLNYGKRP
jgi:hypothetical protein